MTNIEFYGDRLPVLRQAETQLLELAAGCLNHLTSTQPDSPVLSYYSIPRN